MADVGPIVSGPSQPYLGIHVCPIQIHQPTVLVDDATDLPDPGFEDSVGGGVGDHDGRKVFGVLLGFRPELVHIDVTLLICLDHHDLHSGHDRTGRIGAVG